MAELYITLRKTTIGIGDVDMYSIYNICFNCTPAV